jgi:hypothetical protein
MGGANNMAEPRLVEARDLKCRATALRTLDEAIRVLATQLPNHQPTATDTAKLRAELADAYGMKGGILRRAGELDAALDAFSAGARIEESDNLSITYNRSNVIILSVMTKGLNRTDHIIHEKLATIIGKLEFEIAGVRHDEWWAWSDLCQFYLLNGEPDKARTCYRNAISRTGATSDEIKRHVTILDELADKTAATAPGIAASIRAVAEELLRQNA